MSSSKVNNDIIVVGGGITGLCTAYIAAKAGKKVVVLEASEHFGGLLSTFEIGNNKLEHYYHHFFTHDVEIHWLIEELGLSDKLHFKETRMGIFRNGKIFDFSTPKDLLHFSPLNLVDKFRWGASSFFLGKCADWRKYEHIPAIDWFYRWAGKNATNSIWKPLLEIKFGPFANRLPLAWMIGRLKQRMSSRKKGSEQLGYLQGSLNILLEALINKLKELDVTLINNAPIESISTDNECITGAKTTTNSYLGDKIIFTIPSEPIARILHQHNAEISNKINEVKYFGAICTILEVDRQLSDIYWLNVADEGFPFGGIIEHTNFVGPEHYDGKHIIYLSRYFSHDESVAKMSKEELINYMTEPLDKIYKGFQASWIKDIHVFKTNTAATICDLNFSSKVLNAELPIKNLYLANMMHIYPDERSVNNSIRVAKAACNEMGINTNDVPEGNSLAAKIGFNK